LADSLVLVLVGVVLIVGFATGAFLDVAQEIKDKIDDIISEPSPTPYPTSQPTATPYPTQTPQPTPTATPVPLNNLAKIPTDWSLTFGVNPQIIALDNTVTRTAGEPSIRLDPYVSGGNTARECDGRWCRVAVGDRVVARCWIKTDSKIYGGVNPQYQGARCGVDVYGYKNGVWQIIDSYPHNGVEHVYSMVSWGTTAWTLKGWDFTVTDSDATHVVMWLQGQPSTFEGKAWFADAELYINP
jgi:hypothetical protein